MLARGIVPGTAADIARRQPPRRAGLDLVQPPVNVAVDYKVNALNLVRLQMCPSS